MPTRKAEAEWKGDLKHGQGWFKTGSGSFEGTYSFGTRFEEDPGTNPEELIGAAHAGCFSMAFAGDLGKAGFNPVRIHTTEKVTVEKVGDGFTITKAQLHTEAEIPGIDEDAFQKIAHAAKEGCPVSRALVGGPEITLEAVLLTPAQV